MLRQLVIDDLAVIDRLNLDFKPGMTVLTGETGAGKSILLDALGLILGDRADTALIRGDREKTEITAIFSINDNPGIESVLENSELDTDDDLFIRRIIRRDGRSRAYLNNTPVPIQTLRELGEYLIDIHGQHAHQSLSRSTAQREILDGFGDYGELLAKTKSVFAEWKQTKQRLEHINTGNEDYAAKLTLINYQIEELSGMNLKPDEYAGLTDQYKRLSNAQHLLNVCHGLYDELVRSEPAIHNRLVKYQHDIEALCRIDNQLDNIATLINNASIHIKEAGDELRNYIDHFETDSDLLSTLESRLDKLNDLSRKHKVRPEELPDHLSRLSTELERLESGREQQAALLGKKQALSDHYFELAKSLHEARLNAAVLFGANVTEKMHELGMAGKFEIGIESIDSDEPRKHGMDKLTFMVSTNPGQPLRPVTKVASGGELSRLSLAIQIIGMQDKGIPTMIFDEVDAGIGGGIAEIVGKMLNTLAQRKQVFCVTHLAQVAACGHQHLRVIKTTQHDDTYTTVAELTDKARVDEVARMLAGMTITDESRAHALQMLKAG